MSKEVSVFTYLFPAPNKEFNRGGTFILKSLKALEHLDVKVKVIFYLPLNFFFKLNRKRYSIGGIEVLVIYYIPKLSSVFPQLDLFLKGALFRINKLVYSSFYNSSTYYYQTLYPAFQLSKFASKKVRKVVICRGTDVNHHLSLTAINKSTRKLLENPKVSVIAVSRVLGEIFKEKVDYKHSIKNLYTISNTNYFNLQHPISGFNKLYFIGNLIESKGVFELLQFFKKAKQINPKSSLTIIGCGPDHGRMIEYVESNGLSEDIEFLGYVSNEKLPSLINSLDVFVFPSHNEGLPNVVVESVLCGRPVIATNVGGTVEIAEDNNAFYLIPSKNVEGIILAYQELITQDLIKVRVNCLKNSKIAASRFNENVHSQQLKEILFDVN